MEREDMVKLSWGGLKDGFLMAGVVHVNSKGWDYGIIVGARGGRAWHGVVSGMLVCVIVAFLVAEFVVVRFGVCDWEPCVKFPNTERPRGRSRCAELGPELGSMVNLGRCRVKPGVRVLEAWNLFLAVDRGGGCSKPWSKGGVLSRVNEIRLELQLA
ncbi:hypothetical protein Salat_1445900 [Sesamum alatum]|uniref:Uncharacterized protein n=1 Tax=Sesamum alatum TaxID=300844 RepID=A0AAE1YAY7_9LAMI|nr:hypothetical protein Salat_1445900 [Sesamum alatum]